MNAVEYKQLSQALAHLKKVDGKLNISCEDDLTDQYLYSAHTKVQAALVSLERALMMVRKGC